MDSKEVNETSKIQETPFSKAYLQGVDHCVKDWKLNEGDSGRLANLEQLLKKWPDIQKTGISLQENGIDELEARKMGMEAGYLDTKQAYFGDDESKEKLNDYTKSFISSFETYIQENEIDRDKAENMRQVYEECATIIQNLGAELEAKGYSIREITEIADEHGRKTAEAAAQFESNETSPDGEVSTPGEGVPGFTDNESTESEKTETEFKEIKASYCTGFFTGYDFTINQNKNLSLEDSPTEQNKCFRMLSETNFEEKLESVSDQKYSTILGVRDGTHAALTPDKMIPAGSGSSPDSSMSVERVRANADNKEQESEPEKENDTGNRLTPAEIAEAFRIYLENHPKEEKPDNNNIQAYQNYRGR